MSKNTEKCSKFTKIDQKENEKEIKLFLIRAGIKCDFIGFTYLTFATQLVLDVPKLLHNLRALFKIVAEEYDEPNPLRVEANIQNAIRHAYVKNGLEGINKLYGMQVLSKGHKPTTAEMLSLCAEYVHLNLFKSPIKFENSQDSDTHNTQKF